MPTTYRRHLKNCKHRSAGRTHRHCRCPIWADGFVGGQEIRKSLKLRDWEKAQDKIREWEAEGIVPKQSSSSDGPLTIETAKEEFLADCEARKLKPSTIDRHRILFRQLDTFAKSEGLRFLNELTTPALNRFRATWKGNSGLADLKKLERLRAFFKFTIANGYVDKNPAPVMRNPKIRPNPALPFSSEEIVAILAAAERKIAGDCPLPAFVVKELENLPRVSPSYWFWSGTSTLRRRVKIGARL